MRLDEILKLISETDPTHWEVLEGYPIFHHAFELTSTGSGDAAITGVETHTYRAVLRADIDVALEWGARRMRGEDEFYPWNNPPLFADPSVQSFWVDMFYRGGVVYREMLVGVDGWRAVLPVADSRRSSFEEATSAPGTGEYVGYTSRREYDLARLIDGLGGHREFENYFSRSGFRIE